MMQLGLVGIGAGAAAALLFATATSGSPLSILLFYLAPLPIMIAGLGWSHWAAAVAALSGAIAVGVVSDSMLFFAFLAGVGIPAWWLSYLTMLARPAAANGGTATLEWYPPGRLVAWGAILAALFVVAVLIFSFGVDADSFRDALSKTMTAILRRFYEMNPELSGANNSERVVAFLVATMPPTAAMVAAITNVVNLWLAARIVSFSGLLKRPWPDLSAISFPKMLIAALAMAVVLNFAGGMLGIIAVVVSSTLLLAFAMIGLAVLHTVTRGFVGRPFILGSAYVSVPLLQGAPILALCLLGIAETAFDLRARFARRRAQGGPPTRT
jgi:hypothetical protein